MPLDRGANVNTARMPPAATSLVVGVRAVFTLLAR
jgi:hypothetical protein